MRFRMLMWGSVCHQRKWVTRTEKEAVCVPSSGRAFRFAMSRSVRLSLGRNPSRHSWRGSARRCTLR